jgi:hypothetical protein
VNRSAANSRLCRLKQRRAGGSAGSATEPGSDAETAAALGTAGTDHGTTAAGTHANEETVGALAANDGRLIGAFHDRNPCRKARDYNLLGVFLSSSFYFLHHEVDDKACG